MVQRLDPSDVCSERAENSVVTRYRTIGSFRKLCSTLDGSAEFSAGDAALSVLVHNFTNGIS